MDLTNITYESLHRYFTRLSLSGYVKYSSVNALLILSYIYEIASQELNAQERLIVNKALSCLLGNNCMIPDLGCKRACN